METIDCDWCEVRQKKHDQPGLKPRFDEIVAKGVDVHIGAYIPT